MWAADAFSLFATEEIWVVFAPYEAAGVLLDRIVGIHPVKVRHGKEAGHIGIIHQE